MNALTPAAFARLPICDPLKALAARLYAAALPEITERANVPSPLAYDGEDTDVINRHALRVALAMVSHAAERGSADRFHGDYAELVKKLADALLVGDDSSSRYARSCSIDDLDEVEDAGSKLRDAAEDIASGKWSV